MCQRGAGKNAPLRQQIEKLDTILIAQRAQLLKAYPEYARERERLKRPRSAWWWHLDKIRSEIPTTQAKPNKKKST